MESSLDKGATEMSLARQRLRRINVKYSKTSEQLVSEYCVELALSRVRKTF